MEKTRHKLWGGRFNKPTDRSVEAFTASITFDRRLAPYDVAGSIAHARMLGRQGIIPSQDAQAIMAGLQTIQKELEEGTFPFREEYEDIHMNVEVRLREHIGDVAGKLHTARSRNDQVALDVRLFLKDKCMETIDGLTGMQGALCELAEKNIDAIIPGYTHLQRAQPVLLAHHLLAYFNMFERDKGRFKDCMIRADEMPLGSGALAGVPYPVDREFLAKELGFSRITLNSMDAVSDRDFIVEYQSAAAIAMVHLSRMAEDVILWSSSEFGFLELDDSYATGSSIMPQKKNPDVAELARGKSGRVVGNLMSILTILKGLPLTYNRDLQEDKEGLFDTVDTLLSSLYVFSGMLTTASFKADAAKEALSRGYLLATDVADYLTAKGLPFREAHEVVGNLVGYAAKRGEELSELTLDEYRQFSSLFADDILGLSVEASIAARDVVGGTAPRQVRKSLSEAKQLLEREP
ncbi:MAG: argininosuccinate lyase [Dehalococcoidia bacterium]|nr:argininosuccinate lyase [Dehalococcoidia bacterium]